MQSSDLHAVFVAWAKANGETQWTSKGLGSALMERGFVSKKSSVNYWLDVEMTKTVDDFVDAAGNARQVHAGDAHDASMDYAAAEDWDKS